ncbi:head-tail adaptor protein [Marinovum algicola]|uniref:phage head completion protein n=1 Tax=Marinovum algicola TaxID=42444 RepID=UPI003B525C28
MGVMLHEKVRFDCRATVDDGAGNEESGDWTELCQAMADIEERPGSETPEGGRMLATRPCTIRVRRNLNTVQVQTKHRAFARGEAWRILSVAWDRKAGLLVIACEAGGAP